MRLLALLLCSAAAVAQTPTAVEFHFERPGLTPPNYSILITSERLGTYAENSSDNAQQITVSSATWARLIVPVEIVRAGTCETRLKNIAKTGEKTLGYKLGDAEVHCTFNFSDNEALNEAAATLEAIAATIHAGERLAHDHRFDRLSIDPEMEFLESEAKAGRAIEIQNIAAVLKSIIDDERVIERARRRAARLLESSAEPAKDSLKP